MPRKKRPVSFPPYGGMGGPMNPPPPQWYGGPPHQQHPPPPPPQHHAYPYGYQPNYSSGGNSGIMGGMDPRSTPSAEQRSSYGYNPPSNAPYRSMTPEGSVGPLAQTSVAASSTQGASSVAAMPSSVANTPTVTGVVGGAPASSLENPSAASLVGMTQTPASTTATGSKGPSKTPTAHPRHQGKLPGRKKRGRPVGSGKRKDANTADGSSRSAGGSSSKKSHRKQVGPQASRSAASGAASTASRGGTGGPTIKIVSDEDPNRLVNPLLEIPSESSQNEPVQGAELITLTELVFHKPDTYPLSYLGRLLGFDIPVPTILSTDEEEEKQDGQLFAQQPTHPTPLPDIDTLPFLPKTVEHDVFLQIPPAGRPLPKRRQQPVSKLGDEDDKCTLDFVDPVYAYFLRHGFVKSRCKSGTAHVVAKMAAPLQQTATRSATRQRVVELAKSLQLLPTTEDDWTFDDWTSWSPSGDDTVRPQWTLDDDKVYTTPPSQSFGIVASYKGHPMALLHYKFQWYQMVENRESELIMVMEGMVQRSGSEWIVRESAIAAATVETAESLADGESVAARESIHESQGVPETVMAAPEEPAKPPATEAPKPPAPPVDVDIPNVEINEKVRMILIALALDHARAADVWYCLWNAPEAMVDLNQAIFRMVPLPLVDKKDDSLQQQESSSCVPMICDLKKCSSRYALLKKRELEENTTFAAAGVESAATTEPSFHQRVLVKLPLLEEAKSCFDAAFAEAQRSKRASTTNADSRSFTGATGKALEVVVGIRATLPADDEAGLKFYALTETGEVANEIELQDTTNEKGLPQLDIFRRFPLPAEESKNDEDDEILKELQAKQALLLQAEKALEPRCRSLMKQVVAERVAWEQPEAREQRAEELRLLERHEAYVARRKELDQARQEQCEQDMNAVCSICNDGEVTPENQIIFCEACDVPVHQFCYGIDEIPEGDYYCIACRHFERDKMSKELETRETSTGGRISLPPLPIRCELCPVKKGAYSRLDTSKTEPETTTAKWVHVACAKWQGYDFVTPGKPDMIEDVSPLKEWFRTRGMRCTICQSQRGAYHKCRQEGCDKWLHLACARAIGVCEVVNGEDVEGNKIDQNPWTLMCPVHSRLDPEDIPENPVSVDVLIEMAKELPEDPKPPPPPEPPKPFNKQTGKERRLALANPEYEKNLFDEILSKRFSGFRCEVCWTKDEDGLARCKDCDCVICFTCRFSESEVTKEQKQFKCFSCRFVSEKVKAKEEYEQPQCQFCNQKQGLLLKSWSKPVTRTTFWAKKENEKKFKKTVWGRDTWAHYVCAFWLKGLEVDAVALNVNCTNVVMSSGNGYVHANRKCALCGLANGLKAQCADNNCRARGEKGRGYCFHVTCARQAGYEVQHEDDRNQPFFVHCYFHGGNEYNFRAKIEDLVELEKLRAGKKFSKSEAPMSFPDAARLANQAIECIRVLGWAWRWAEHWVEAGSSWEPLLEEGQSEAKMTKKQLKIIDSTPTSRAADARRCRLSALGAAIRNRSYDTEEGVDNDSLCRALNAILHTSSLVGPLKDYEIEFLVEWLARAYRSKSKFLFLGDDKVPVASDGFCVHQADKSPKYELGSRPIPGKAVLDSEEVFEPPVEEPDDFLLPELLSDGSKCPYPPNCREEVVKREPKYRKPKPGEDESSGDDEPPKKSSKTSDSGKGSKKPTKKEVSLAENQKKKVGRPPRKSEQPQSPQSRFESVAAMVPSAVKKRGHDRRSWLSASTSPETRTQVKPVPMKKDIISTRKKEGLPALPTLVEYQLLLEQDNQASVLRKIGRRGRPPRFLEFVTYLRVGGEEFYPDEYSSDDESDDIVETGITDGVGDPESGKTEFDSANGIDISKDTQVETLTKEEDDAEGPAKTSNQPEQVREDVKAEAGSEGENVPLKTPKPSEKADDDLRARGLSVEETRCNNDNLSPSADACDGDAQTRVTNAENGDPPDLLGASKPEAAKKDTNVVHSSQPKPKRMLAGLSSPILEGTRNRRPTKHLSPSIMNNTYDDSNAGEEREREKSDGPTPRSRKRKRGTRTSAEVKVTTSPKRKKRLGHRSSEKVDEADDESEPADDDDSFEPSNDADDEDVDGTPLPEGEEKEKEATAVEETDRARRSSRHSSAREMSLKEPDDIFTDADEEKEGGVSDGPAPRPRKRKRGTRTSAEAEVKVTTSPKRKKRLGRRSSKKVDEADDESEPDNDDDSFEPSNDPDDEEVDVTSSREGGEKEEEATAEEEVAGLKTRKRRATRSSTAPGTAAPPKRRRASRITQSTSAARENENGAESNDLPPVRPAKKSRKTRKAANEVDTDESQGDENHSIEDEPPNVSTNSVDKRSEKKDSLGGTDVDPALEVEEGGVDERKRDQAETEAPEEVAPRRRLRRH